MHVKKPGDEKVDVLLVHFLSNFTGDIMLGEEVEKYKWFDVNNLPENIAPNIKPTLRHFEFL